MSRVLNSLYKDQIKINSIRAKSLSDGRFEIQASLKVLNSLRVEEVIESVSKIEDVYFVNRNNYN